MNSLCTTPWESKKIINMFLMRDLWNFSFFGRGDVSPTHSEFCRLVSGSQAKHHVSSPVIILLKNFCLHRPSRQCLGKMWLDPLFAQVSRSVEQNCTQISLSQFFFHNPKNYSLGDVQRFCYHSWCESTVIFDQISNSNNVYLSSGRFWTATSLVIFYQFPSVSKSRIPPKNFWSVQSFIPISLCTSTSVSAANRPTMKQNFMATLCSFPPPMTYKENRLYKTSYNSYTVEDK